MENIQELVKASQSSLEDPGMLVAKLPKVDKPSIIVFRHGQTHDNIRRIFCGRRDSKLTAEGKKQAAILAAKLQDQKIDVLITANLSRCKETARIAIGGDKGDWGNMGIKLEMGDSLLERDYGDLTGKSKTALSKKDPILTAKYRRGWDFPPPNGESLKMVWENRILPFCTNLENRIKRDNINIAICCTNNTMRLIRMYFEKLTQEEMLTLENPLAQDYCAYKID